MEALTYQADWSARAVLALALLLAAPALAAPWAVAQRPHGQVRFKVEGPLDDVLGETREVGGALELDPADWAKGKGLVSVTLNALKTGIDQRDQDMRDEFLEAARFPFALLAIDRIDRPSAAALTVGQEAQGEAVGSFELHGVRRAIRIPITARLEDAGRLWVKGSFEVPFADYNIRRPSRLFLKLGETADASFEVLFSPQGGAPQAAAKPEAAGAAAALAPPTAPTVATVLPMAPKAKPRPVKRRLEPAKLPLLFSGQDARAQGERLFADARVGGEGNKLACVHCHAKADERSGVKQADGYARPASTVWNSAQRGKYWGGMAQTAADAASICQRKFMGGQGLSAQDRGALQAFLDAISPDPMPEQSYGAFYRTLESSLRDPVGGDVLRGKGLADTWCQVCHKEGVGTAPPLAMGLYEPDWLVRRVRWLEGHQSRGCPPTSIARLPDSDLRDIVSYLSGPKAGEPIFKRKK